MPRLEYQVFRKDLSQPEMAIGMFGATRRDATDQAFLMAEKLRSDLNDAGIKFAAVDGDPLITIYVGEKDCPRVQEAGIKLPGIQ